MRAVSIFVAVLCLAPLVNADTIQSVAPASIFVGNVEDFIVIRGDGLTGTESTFVEFAGPGGTLLVEASLVESTMVTVYIPFEVAATAGRYSITVVATDTGVQSPRRIGPADFDVIARPEEGPPLLNLPEVLAIEAQSGKGSLVQFTVTARSFDTAGATITCDHASGALFPIGTTIVSCTATDSFGSASGQFLVVVADTGLPILTVPGDISTANPVVTFTASAVDVIDGPLPVTCTPASGSTFPTGTTVVQCEATDSSQNVGTAQFNVSVSVLPQLVLPADITVEATSPAGAVVNYVATATDGSPVTCTPASGATFSLGATTVQCSATNAGGTTTGSFNVTVRDTTAPQIVFIQANPSFIWPPNHKMVHVIVAVVARDTVDVAPISRITKVTSNQSDNGQGDGNTTGDISITGPLSLDLRAERSQGQDRVYTITVECVDASHNATTATVQVRVTNGKSRGVR